MGIDYIYQVYNKDKPMEVVSFASASEVARYCGVRLESVMTAINKQQSINHFDITRLKIPRVKTGRPPRGDARKRVMVIYPDGNSYTYNSVKECAEALGLRPATVTMHLSKGTKDRNGRVFDEPWD